MIAIACDWGGDLTVGPSGDINVVPTHTELRQRIIRRLLTNPGDYVWHTGYGAGLGNFVGEPYSQSSIEGTILSQLQFEALVAQEPAPKIQTGQSPTGSFSSTSVEIHYSILGTTLGDYFLLGLG